MNQLHYHGNIHYYNGYIYMFGGVHGGKIEYIYPFENSSFTDSQDNALYLGGRSATSTTLLPNGYVYIIAGHNGGNLEEITL